MTKSRGGKKRKAMKKIKAFYAPDVKRFKELTRGKINTDVAGYLREKQVAVAGKKPKSSRKRRKKQ